MRKRRNENKISRLIDERMKAKGINTTRDLAVICDIGEATIYRIMSGSNYPTLPKVMQICEVLGITPQEFIDAILV